MRSEASTPAPPTPLEKAVEKAQYGSSEGDWGSRFLVSTNNYLTVIALTVLSIEAGLVVRRPVWFAAALGATTQIQSSDDAQGHFTAGSFASGALGSGAPEAGIIQNGARGRAFEGTIIERFGLPAKNTETMLGELSSGSLEPTIPDLAAGGTAPLGDIKDILKAARTRQMEAQLSVGRMTDVPHKLILSPRIQSVSRPLAAAVQDSGGFIFRADPVTFTVEAYDASTRTWVPFLGGSWGF